MQQLQRVRPHLLWQQLLLVRLAVRLLTGRAAAVLRLMPALLA
jgi:hypothetical protein